jgi:hypothetical protein
MSDNLDRFKELDDAYNARDWDAYSALLDDGFRGWSPGDARPQGKAEHVRTAQTFCTASADNQVHNAPYIVAVAKGDWTCTIARLTGTITAPLLTSDGRVMEPANQPFETSFATFSRWTGGKLVEEFAFLDAAVIMRQVSARTNHY